MSKHIIFFLLLISLHLLSCNVPSESMVQKQLFDLNWKFYPDDIRSGELENILEQNWYHVDLPFDAQAQNTKEFAHRPLDMYNFDTIKSSWFSKSFNIPQDWKNNNITIQFDDGNADREVFINGSQIDPQQQTGTEINYNLTPFISYQTENTIAFRLKKKPLLTTEMPQHVWLIITETMYSGI